jgi:hypothetical protein
MVKNQKQVKRADKMKITEKELKDLIKDVILESHTKEQEEELEEIVGELENASKMHKSQAERIQKILDDTDDEELKEQMTYTEKDIPRLEKEFMTKKSIAALQALRGLAQKGKYDMKKLKSGKRSMKEEETVTENLNCGCGNDPCITFGVISIEEARKIVQEEIQADLDEAKKKKKKKTDKDRMKCNSPRRIRKGEAGHGTKKFVVKACKDGKEKIIRYGDAKMEIKKDSPERRKSFRARHKCDTAKDKMSARYWSCKKW